jgi:hypothetical protein
MKIMIRSNVRKVLVSLVLTSLLLVTACSSKQPSRFDQAQQQSTQRGSQPVIKKESTAGGSFNKFFPPAGDGYKLVYAQEKKGFAEAKLNKNGKQVAALAISDVLNNPSAADKFKNSKEKIGGYPAVKQGSTANAVLVNSRYQVKVLSKDTSFTESDRKAWLAKFNLSGLSNLK